MKKGIAVLLVAVCLLLGLAAAAGGKTGIDWTAEKRSRLRVGNPTPLQGRFFTDMWGGTTGDQDVRALLHACSPVRYDSESGWFLLDRSVVQDMAALDDEEGNRTYLIAFYDDLRWSDGTRITAYDYAFSILLCMDPAIGETGGTPMDYTWITGAEEYRNKTEKTVSGLQVISDEILQIKVKADALPYYYELSRLMIHPYPISVIAPGLSVLDDGAGAYLSSPLTAEMIRSTVLDESAGYLAHPSVVSGPYMLSSFDGSTAVLTINPYFKGMEDGIIPRIGELEYTAADNADMVEKLEDGEYDLLKQITDYKIIQSGIHALLEKQDFLTWQSQAQAGLTLIRFREDCDKVQELAIRQAIALCFDRDSFIRRCIGPFGEGVDGLYSLDRRTVYRIATPTDLDSVLPAEATPTNLDPAAPEEDETEKEQDVSYNIEPDDLKKYELDIDEAVRLLEEAGWTLNENGAPFDPQKDLIRYKQTEVGMTGLNLMMAMTGTKEEWRALEVHFVSNLRKAGIGLTVIPVSGENLQEGWYDQAGNEYDLLYLAEALPIAFDPELLAPETETDSELHRIKTELCLLAQDMIQTEPQDVTRFMQRWATLQERIMETLPILPICTNDSFDFFSRSLHNYRIDQAAAWSEAITESYMSDIEELAEEEKEAEQEELNELEQRFLY